MDAADKYLEVLWEMMTALEHIQQEKVQEEIQVVDTLTENTELLDTNWMDMDSVVLDYCNKNLLKFPEDIDKKMDMHLDALCSLLNQ